MPRVRRLAVSPLNSLERQRVGCLGSGGVEGGVQNPFFSHPSTDQGSDQVNRFAPNSIRGRALAKEIDSLIAKGAVELAPRTPGYYSRVFVVMKASGTWRPIIDLSLLNKSVKGTKFRMETIQSVLASVS